MPHCMHKDVRLAWGKNGERPAPRGVQAVAYPMPGAVYGRIIGAGQVPMVDAPAVFAVHKRSFTQEIAHV